RVRDTRHCSCECRRRERRCPCHLSDSVVPAHRSHGPRSTENGRHAARRSFYPFSSSDSRREKLTRRSGRVACIYVGLKIPNACESVDDSCAVDISSVSAFADCSVTGVPVLNVIPLRVTLNSKSSQVGCRCCCVDDCYFAVRGVDAERVECTKRPRSCFELNVTRAASSLACGWNVSRNTASHHLPQ